MEVRKAEESDIDAVAKIYSLIHDQEEAGKISVGWARAVYPTRTTAEEALKRRDLFVAWDHGQVVGAAIINQIQPDAYAQSPKWQPAPDDQVMVLHTLVVDPRVSGHGYGKLFLEYYERYALDHGCHFLRIDTQAKNHVARNMYRKLGFKEVEVVSAPFNGLSEVELVLLEKQI